MPEGRSFTVTIQENRHHYRRILAKAKRNKPYLETARLIAIHAKSHNPCTCAICKVSRIKGLSKQEIIALEKYNEIDY
jgi:hypothetical protein